MTSVTNEPQERTNEDEPPRRRDEQDAIGEVGRSDPSEETDAEDAPESQQAG